MDNNVTALLGNTDIYLVDQIMKGRYHPGARLLDAGCGYGRNLYWFVQQDFEIHGVDSDAESIRFLQASFPQVPADRFKVADVDNLPYPDQCFDGIISSAVLHFARDTAHFFSMLDEHVRVLKIGGSLFIRMASDIGIEDKTVSFGNCTYQIPDGSTRFLLTRALLAEIDRRYRFAYLEPLKVVNVADQRCMSTLVIGKDF